MKKCNKCQQTKESIEFHKHKRSKDGLNAFCKLCKKEYEFNYRLEHKDAIKSQQATYYVNNTQKILNKTKAWRAQNIENDRKRKQVYNKTRLSDTAKLARSIRSRLSRIISNQSTSKLVDCSWAELKTHLESQFLPDMTWENHSLYGWHIDHIIPLSAFDLSDPEQLKKACHYTNLRPLWAKDNLSKGSKILGYNRDNAFKHEADND